MTHTPLPLSQDWVEQVVRDGAVELGTFGQPQLIAADIDLSPSRAENRELKSTFEQLDPDEQRRAIDSARSAPIDPQILAILSSASSDPLVRGSWNNTPAWFRPLTASYASTLRGAALADGSMACLDAAVDLVTSRVTVRIRSLPQQARQLAAEYFAADPPVPPDVTPDDGWTDETGGGLAMLTLVWPRGRGTRAVSWRITRTSSKSETAFLQTRADYGRKRSIDDSVTEAQFAQRLLDTFTDAWAQAR
jgi:hypothetical protein